MSMQCCKFAVVKKIKNKDIITVYTVFLFIIITRQPLNQPEFRPYCIHVCIMNWIAGQTHVNKSQKNGPDPWCSNSDKHIEKHLLQYSMHLSWKHNMLLFNNW